jgi:hypothetical protein
MNDLQVVKIPDSQRMENYEKKTELYTKKTTLGRLNRHYTYIKNMEDKDEKKYHASTLFTSWIASAGSLIVGHSLIKNKIESITSNEKRENKTIVDHIIENPITSSLLAIGGAVLGTSIYMHILENSTKLFQFNAWRQKNVSEIIEKEFVAHIDFDEDEVLQQHVCQLSECVMKTPVKAPNGQTYDLESVKKYLKKDLTGKFIDPKRSANFYETDLVPDHEEFVLIYKRLIFILKRERSLAKEDSAAYDALNIYINELQKIVTYHHSAIKEEIDARFYNVHNDSTRYMVELGNFFRKFGFLPVTEIYE